METFTMTGSLLADAASAVLHTFDLSGDGPSSLDTTNYLLSDIDDNLYAMRMQAYTRPLFTPQPAPTPSYTPPDLGHVNKSNYMDKRRAWEVKYGRVW